MLKQIKLVLVFITLMVSISTKAQTQSACLSSKDEQNMALCAGLAAQGDAEAQNTLGEIYYQDALLIKGYHTKARILFEQAAAQGLAQAQYNLGAIYRDEFNHFPIALSWFEKAAAQGNLDAMNSIGYIYENGFGGESPRLYIFDKNGKNIDPQLPNIEAMFAPYEFRLPVKAYPRAIYPMSEYGQGIEPDLNKAVEWYQKAAVQGHALAQTNLAYLYFMGVGVDKNDQKAFQLYQQAATQNFVPALKSLAFMYVQGLGTRQDIPKAFHALEKAYTLQPEYNLWNIIWRMETNEDYKQYHLKMSITDQDTPYRKQFDYLDSSDEDYIHERFKYFKHLYQLDFINASGKGSLYTWMRPTLSIVVGNTVGENSIVKKRLLLKEAIQGYYGMMTSLSYYYKAEEEDMLNAQLWRKYAINMGESKHPRNWPGYDEASTDEQE